MRSISGLSLNGWRSLYSRLGENLVKRLEINCEYQPYLDRPPISKEALYGQSCANDSVTVNSWRDTWISNATKNHEKFKSFKDYGLGKLFGKHKCMPAIVIGSGPHLKENAAKLKDNPGIPTISCLHNFHYLEDLGVGADYYVSLDAGPLTIEEVYEGGSKDPDAYWAMTKGKKLICYVGTHPGLLEKWQGEVYFFNCPVPDKTVLDEIDKLEPFRTAVSSGGNVLGAATYIAKAFFGCNPIIFMGASFCFSYDYKFHGWDSKYDAKLGQTVRMVDVYGNSVLSWTSYSNFKAWFDYITLQVPGIWINCTEGGTMGAHLGGNLRSIMQMDLEECFKMYDLCHHMKEQSENPAIEKSKILF